MANRIKELREARSWTQEHLGEMVGVGWQTVSRWENGDDVPTPKLRRLTEVFGVTIAELLDPTPGIRRIIVKGDVQAGAWAESWEWDAGDWFEIGVTDDPGLRAFTLRGARTSGPSMDRRYPDGTILVFTEIAETGEGLVPGRRYIVERERADGLREATVKKLWCDPDTNEYYLVPESNDPRFQEPIPLNGGENDTIRVIGRVVGSYQRE